MKKEISPYMDYPLHYHAEFEIIYVEKSYGIRLMGNHVGNFTDGDLMFISPNLPHVWKNDTDFYKEDKDLYVVVYVIHFTEDALGKDFFGLPEFANIRKLFLHGQQGILIKGHDHNIISELIKKVYETLGIDRLVLFLKTLDAFANAQEYELLSSPSYQVSLNLLYTERIDKVVNFLITHFTEELQIGEIAKLVNMNKSSFCRFFKMHTHKTCSQFINRIRIANACKLLINTNMTATQICYETGYNNISHFNRQFKLITGTTAKVYTKKYLKNT